MGLSNNFVHSEAVNKALKAKLQGSAIKKSSVTKKKTKKKTAKVRGKAELMGAGKTIKRTTF